MTSHQPSAGHTLFPGVDCYTTGEPLDHGFYHLELPDGYRWIMSEATCRLPGPPSGYRPAQPVLLVRIGPGSFGWTPYLSIFVNGVYTDTQSIDAYGTYYFDLDPAKIDLTAELEITLRVNNAEPEPGSLRRLALGIYELRLLDLGRLDESFDERALFIEQANVFTSITGLGQMLKKARIGAGSLILDVGAGTGWTTVLLALATGARVIAVDPHPYDAPSGVSFKADLRRRFARQFPVLRQSAGFTGIKDFTEVERAIDRCLFLPMSAEEMLSRDDSFDFAFSLNAFEHIPHPGRALAEIRRTLKPGGYAFILFHLLYYCDRGHHLHTGGLLDQPWVHLLHDRAEIKAMIQAAGKPVNEVDNILDSLNGWTVRQYEETFKQSGLKILDLQRRKGFTIPDARKSEAFRQVRERYPLEDLTTTGMEVHLLKKP